MSTEVNKTPQKLSTMRSFLNGDQLREQIRRALPALCSSDRFLRIAITTLNKTPKLADCTQESLVNCLLSLAQLGLEPDDRLAHLVPYGNQCTLVLNYKGIAVLMMRSGLVSNLHADVVCENDVFTYRNGRVDHEINFKEPRGAVYAAYCVCRLKDGTEKHEVMSMEDIQQVRASSKSGNAGPWKNWASEMYKKSVFKRLSKWMPWESDHIKDMLEKDDDFIEHEEKEVPSVVSKLEKGTSRIEQMKQRFIENETDKVAQLHAEEESQPLTIFYNLKNLLLMSSTKEALYERYDKIRDEQALTDDEKKTLDALFTAKEKELEN